MVERLAGQIGEGFLDTLPDSGLSRSLETLFAEPIQSRAAKALNFLFRLHRGLANHPEEETIQADRFCERLLQEAYLAATEGSSNTLFVYATNLEAILTLIQEEKQGLEGGPGGSTAR